MLPLSAFALWRPTPTRAINATKAPRSQIGTRILESPSFQELRHGPGCHVTCKKSPAQGRALKKPLLPALRSIPIVNVLARLILSDTVSLLDFAFELIAFAIDGSEVIIGELAPLLLDGALNLLPVSFDTVPVHDFLLLKFFRM